MKQDERRHSLLARIRDRFAARHERTLRRAAMIAPDSQRFSARSRRLRVLGLWLAAVLIGGFFDSADSWGFGFGFGWFEGYAYNAASSVRARLRVQDEGSDFVIVPLSDDTFSQTNISSLPGPPVPRNYHAQLIRFLTEANAQIIAFDLVFDASRPEDKEFAEAVRDARRKGTQVIWACIVDESDGLLLPNEELTEASSNIAHVLVERNATRPVIERVPAFIIGQTEKERIPAMSVKIALLKKGIIDQTPQRVAHAWQIEDMRVPIENDGTFFISYGSSTAEGFPYVPYENIIEPGEEANFYKTLFTDKVVLIGDTTKLGNDWKDTPLGHMPGVEVHAHAASTLLNAEFLKAAPIWLNLLFVALLPALLAPFHDTRYTRTLILMIGVLSVGYFLLAMWSFVELDMAIHFIGPLVAFSLFCTGLLIERGLRAERERARMLDALVLAASSAIETRDPSTAGHSRRVTCMTIELAIAASAYYRGQYKKLRFNKTQIKELCYAALLHDFGKIGVRESVLTKSHKLEPMHFQVVKDRLLLLKSTRRAEYLCRKIELLEAATLDPQQARARQVELEAEYEKAQQALDDNLRCLERANNPQVTWMPDDEYSNLLETLEELERQTYYDEQGTAHPLISAEEKAALSIRKGSLTQQEFQQIQDHAQMSYDFLKQIHWTRDLENLAHIAWGHHEKLSGKGYPRGVTADEIPPTTRMMTIADIFDALTASDRPYKKAMPTERALAILKSEVEDGNVDGDLLHIFMERRVYEATCDGRGDWLLS